MDVRFIDTRCFKISIQSKEVNTNISNDIKGYNGNALYHQILVTDKNPGKNYNDLKTPPLYEKIVNLALKRSI